MSVKVIKNSKCLKKWHLSFSFNAESFKFIKYQEVYQRSVESFKKLEAKLYVYIILTYEVSNYYRDKKIPIYIKTSTFLHSQIQVDIPIPL